MRSVWLLQSTLREGHFPVEIRRISRIIARGPLRGVQLGHALGSMIVPALRPLGSFATALGTSRISKVARDTYLVLIYVLSVLCRACILPSRAGREEKEEGSGGKFGKEML